MVTSTPLISADQRPQRQAEQGGRQRPPIGEAGGEQQRKRDADQPVRRSHREVEILVHDDEGHPDGNHGIARRVAQDGEDGVAAAKKAGLISAPTANKSAISTSRPSSQPPTNWVGIRPK
jgi:hypothetical protein